MNIQVLDNNLLALTVKIVSAYVANNSVQSAGLPDLIASVQSCLQGLGKPAAPVQTPAIPAVPIKKSITPDHLVCLEDGKRFKSLKRHIRIEHGMTPDQYRARWDLPADYPMVAPNYTEARSAIAKAMGLGRKPGTTFKKAETTPAKRGRPAKATPANE